MLIGVYRLWAVTHELAVRKLEKAVRQNPSVRVSCAIILTVAVAITAASGQGTSGPKASINGVGAGTPGSTVSLPVTLKGARGTDIVEIAFHVAFPKQLSFVRLERGALLGKGVETEWEVQNPELQEGEEPSTAAVGQASEIRITRSSEAAPLRDGILAFLVFRIDSEATTQELLLTNDVTIFASGVPKEKVAAYSEGTTIFVETADVPSMFACFFYMH